MSAAGVGVPDVPGYEGLERVGSGGFSNVYRAHQTGFDRTVALKVLTVELFDAKAQHRFERECRASGRLSNHPNIVTVLDSGFTADGRPYIATEFMSRGALSDRIDAEGPLRVDEVLAIGVKMCAALEAVHDAGILHRDLKPQNILVSDYGEPALADFGISAITVGPHATTGTSSLTPLHTAPEILEGQPTSVASDIYSLGSTLYMLLAGRAPFQGADDEGLLPLMRRVVSDPVPDIGRPDVPGAVVDVLRWSMAKEPAQRYASAAAMGEALQQLQAHLGHPVTPLALPGGRTVGGPAGAVPAPAVTGDAATGGADVPGVGDDPGAATGAGTPAGGPGVGGAAGPNDGGGSTGPGLGAGEPGATAPGPTSRSKTPLVVIGVVAVLALVAGAVLLATRGGSDRSGAAAGSSRTTAPGGNSGGKSGGTGGSGQASSRPAGALTWPSPLRFDAEAVNLPEGAPSPGGTLRLAVGGEPAGWNPAEQRLTGGSLTVAEALFEPLAIIGDDGPEPYLATSITSNDAGDEWTITIPDGLRFSDGTALDADAVRANLEARTTSEVFKDVTAPIRSVRTTGPTTVLVTLRSPWPSFPLLLTSQVGFVASPATLAGDGSTAVGSGPFLLADWVQGESLTLRPNPSFRIAGRPYLDGIDVTFVTDAAARVELLRGGAVDVAYLLDPSTVATQRESAPVIGAAKARLHTIVLNTSTPPFDDLRLRKAATMAVDRSTVNDAAYAGAGDTTYSPFPPGSPWTSDQTSVLGFDPDQARTLVAEVQRAGKPVAVTLLAGTAPYQRQVADVVAEQWRAVGLEVEVQVAGGDEVERIVTGDYQAAMWAYDTPTDPDQWYWWFHSSTSRGDGTLYNLPRLRSPAVDKAFDDLRAAADLDTRQAAAARLEQALVDQVPALWLVTTPQVLSTSPDVVGLDATVDGGTGRGGRPWAVDVSRR